MRTEFSHRTRATIVMFMLLAFVPVAADAQKVEFKAHLKPMVAGVVGNGEGHFIFNTETDQLTTDVTYEGLTSSPTAAHIHGSTGIVVNYPVPESPLSGTATLSRSDAQSLLAGTLYFDVHTAAHPSGEIRGRIAPSTTGKE